MLDAVRAAGQALFDGTSGDVQIKIVAFSTTATSFGPFSTFADFSGQIAAINPAEGGTRPFNDSTNFTAAIEETMSEYVPIPGQSNQVIFISDGNPNVDLGSGGNSLDDDTADGWHEFIDNNGLNVTTVGVGDGINTTRLQDVDLDGQGAPISVTDFDDLIETLLDVVVGGDVSGNVLTNDGFGADGPGRIASIEINGVTYSFDGSDITYDDGGPQTISGSLLPDVPTQIGGTLTFDFATGAWSFTAPTEVASDITGTFNYVIVDRDGDADTASLSIEVQAGNDAPVNSVPASIAVNEDTATKLTGISFADPDIGSSNLTVTLSVASGTLSATSAGGVTVGGTPSALTLAGTVADINAFIANAAQGVTYAPVPGSTTDATLTVTSNDNGNTGIGGAQTDTDTVTLDLVRAERCADGDHHAHELQRDRSRPTSRCTAPACRSPTWTPAATTSRSLCR